MEHGDGEKKTAQLKIIGVYSLTYVRESPEKATTVWKAMAAIHFAQHNGETNFDVTLI
jgi:hypothetical protein